MRKNYNINYIILDD